MKRNRGEDEAAAAGPGESLVVTPAHSPYAGDRLAPPTLPVFASLMDGSKSDEKAVQMTTKVRPEVAYAIDRILEKRVYHLKNRHEFFRLAVMNLVSQCLEELPDHVKTLVYRLNRQRALHGELLQNRHVAEMVTMTRETVKLFLSYDNRLEAIRALREAKRYSEEIPYEGLRRKFCNGLYGSPDGLTRPEPPAWGEAERLWHQVLEGDLDRDDEDEVQERLRVY